LGVAGAGAIVGVASIKMAANFEQATNQLITSAGESRKNIALVRTGLLDLSVQAGASATDLAKGMYLIESAGYHASTGLSVLKAAAEGAKVGGAEMSVVADGLTTAMKDYNIPTSQAAEITSKLIATVAGG